MCGSIGLAGRVSLGGVVCGRGVAGSFIAVLMPVLCVLLLLDSDCFTGIVDGTEKHKIVITSDSSDMLCQQLEI